MLSSFGLPDILNQIVATFWTQMYFLCFRPLLPNDSVRVVSCVRLCDPMNCSPLGSSVHGDSPGKNTGVGCHALLQGIFPNQGSQTMSPALQADSLLSEPPQKSKNTGSVAYPFSRGSSQPRNRAKVSCIAGRSFTS